MKKYLIHTQFLLKLFLFCWKCFFDCWKFFISCLSKSWRAPSNNVSAKNEYNDFIFQFIVKFYFREERRSELHISVDSYSVDWHPEKCANVIILHSSKSPHVDHLQEYLCLQSDFYILLVCCLFTFCSSREPEYLVVSSRSWTENTDAHCCTLKHKQHTQHYWYLQKRQIHNKEMLHK